MMYAMISTYGKCNRSISAAAAILRGYHQTYPLTELERSHLHLLITCRFACSATLGAYSYSQNPENKYLLLHSEPAWKAIELIWGTNIEYRQTIKTIMNQMFHQACDCNPAKSDDESTTEDFIDCSDLALPDPTVVDLMSSVRRKKNDDTTTSENGELPDRKQQKGEPSSNT